MFILSDKSWQKKSTHAVFSHGVHTRLLRNGHFVTVDGESKCIVGSGARGNMRSWLIHRAGQQGPEPRASHVSLRPRHNSAITFPVRGNLHSWSLPV